MPTSTYGVYNVGFSTTEGQNYTYGGRTFTAKQYGGSRAAEDAARAYIQSQGLTPIQFGTPVGTPKPDMSQEYRYRDPGDIHYYMPGGAGYQAGKAITVSPTIVQAIAERPVAAITPGSEVAGIKAQVGQITAPVSHPMIAEKTAPQIVPPETVYRPELGYQPMNVRGVTYQPTPLKSDIEKAALYPAYITSQDITKRISEGAERYLLPFVPSTPVKQLTRGIVEGAASVPEIAATTGLGYELIARDIVTGKPVKGVATRIATGIGMTATELATQFKEEPIETTGQFIGQSLVLGGVGREVKEIKIPEIKTPEFGAFGVKYTPPRPFAKILPAEYPETTGFTGELMGYKEAKINIPETRPTIKPIEPVKLMGFEKAQISIPEIVKGTEKIATETPLMSFKEAKPTIPEIIPSIGKQAKEVPIMGFREAKPFTTETSIKPIEIKPVPGGEARAKAYGEWYLKTKFPEERFNVGGGAVQPTYLRNIGIRANVPPKVAEPLFDIRSGGFVASDILKTASKGQLFMKEPPKIIVEEIPTKTVFSIGKQSKMSLDERIKMDWEKRDRENRKLMKSGFQTTSEGQILLQKQKVDVLDLTKLDETVKQMEKITAKASQKQRIFPLIVPIAISKQSTRTAKRQGQILTPRQISPPKSIPKSILKPMSISIQKPVFKPSELTISSTPTISIFKPESITIQTPISAQKVIQRAAQAEAQIEKQVQEFWTPETKITELKLRSDVTEDFFGRKKRKVKQTYKPQKIYAPVLSPLWDIAGFREKHLKPIRLKSPKIIDITKKPRHRRTKRR